MQALELMVDKATLESESELRASVVQEFPDRLVDGPRVLMAAGGTGGHIFPALAVAEELRSRWTGARPQRHAVAEQHEGGAASTAPTPNGSEQRAPVRRGEIQFLGTGRGLESRLIPAAGFALRTVAAAGLVGISGRKRLHNLLMLPRTLLETAAVLRDFRPSVVLGMGGYLAGPAILEASLWGIPTLLVEPNAVPGFTNRILAPLASAAALGFEEAAPFFGSRARVTGQPVRKAFYGVRPKDHRPPFTVLIMGGSQGSAAINRCLAGSLAMLRSKPLGFIHQTGERDYDTMRRAYEEAAIPAEVHPFLDNVPEALERADLVISRSGAAALGELAAAGKGSVLVPFAAAAEQHQAANARAFERAGAARLVLQSELTPERLVSEIEDLLGRPQGLNQLVEMEHAARSLARPDAASRIADLIEELG